MGRILLIVLVACISNADSCRYIPFLSSTVNANETSASSWYLAATLGDVSSLDKLAQYAVNHKIDYWLQVASTLGNAEAQYEVALKQDSLKLQNSLLKKSARQGFARAQYELSTQADAQQQQFWLTKAAEQGYLPAQIALYQWWQMRDEHTKALPWIELAADHHSESAFLFGRQLWRSQEYKEGVDWLRKAQGMGSEKAAELLTVIDTYWPHGINRHNGNEFKVERQSCPMRLQFVATSLDAVLQSIALQQKFEDDERLLELGICINELQWAESIACSENWQGQRRLGCDVTEIPYDEFKQDFTHLVVVADKGKANVNNGVMYLDLVDTYSVFVHELAHLVGFIDEYALPESLAEQFCHPYLKAPNLVYTAVPVSDSSSIDVAYWQEFGHDVELASAATCSNYQGQAFKPAKRLTFMEYHDQQFIPPLYLSMWKQRLQSKETMVPAYINIAEAYENKDQWLQAEPWWQKYRQFYLN